MLISVHIPKTAGSSFRSTLRDEFADSLLEDYNDFPMHHTPAKRNFSAILNFTKNIFKSYNKIECVHGHFLPIKYYSLSFKEDVKFIMWMRDPVERLASHYFYWKRRYNKDKAPAILRKIMEENWSLEDFCLSEEFRNLYSQYLWRFPLEKFSFIGITEFYDEDLNYFSKEFLGKETKVHRENINKSLKNRKYILDDKLREKIEKFHDKDMELYKGALRMREKRV